MVDCRKNAAKNNPIIIENRLWEKTVQEKVVLVTGGAKRVGAAICRRLHAQGARIAIHYRSSVEEARALQHEFTRKRPDSASVVQADLLDIDL
ncbi:MAG TPA: hypothetical protein DEF07_01905, partial [Nitrosomonas sp.]|nr:hypothetical protein [Nitrosomonas sp.]